MTITGHVISWDTARGFGFVRCDFPVAAADLFIHVADVARTNGARDLAVGARVQFAIDPGHSSRRS